MLILTIRTDKSEAEIGLYQDQQQKAYDVWLAYRELSRTLHARIEKLLGSQGVGLQNIEGIVCFKGPGSFTGLRIGLSAANALAYALGVPILAKSNPQWLECGIAELLAGNNEKIVLPEYGAPVHITEQRK